MSVSAFIPPNPPFWQIRGRQAGIAAALNALRDEADVGLHLGAGSSRIDNMINCDLFDPSADRVVDATALTDFDAESVDLIEHHHMIEHLSFEQFDRAIAEWHRVLKKSGHLVFTCPDIARVCRHYALLGLRAMVSDQSRQIDYTIKMIVGSQEHEGMYHKNHFDPARVRRILPAHGFDVVYTTAYPRRPTPSMLVVAAKI